MGKIDLLGQARRVIVNKDTTTIIAEGTEDAIKIRCEQLRKQINSADTGYEKEKFQDRIAKLSGGTLITQDAGLTLDNIKIDLLGQARRVIVNKDTTTIIAEGTEDAIKIRCEQLR